MVSFLFNQNNYSVTYGSDTVTLLPKEFALFQFLYHHKDQAFSRDSLLDHVWTLEAPTDRTVDDHVYRLRKKLKPLEHIISIKTIRKYGYTLSIHEPTILQYPSLLDEEVKNQTLELMRKYHLFGQGEAMRTLINHQHQLGIEINSFYQLFLRFMDGSLLEPFNKYALSFGEKLFFHLLLYIMIHFDAKDTHFYFQKALDANILPANRQMEITILEMIFVLIGESKIDEALELMKSTQQTVVEKELEGFVIIVHLTECFLYILHDDDKKAENKLTEAEFILGKSPYLRELGHYHIIKGLWKLKQHAFKEAEAFIDEGFSIFKYARFPTLILRTLHHVLYTLTYFQLEHTSMFTKYKNMWDEWDEAFDFAQLKLRIENEIFSQI